MHVHLMKNEHYVYMLLRKALKTYCLNNDARAQAFISKNGVQEKFVKHVLKNPTVSHLL